MKVSMPRFLAIVLLHSSFLLMDPKIIDSNKIKEQLKPEILSRLETDVRYKEIRLTCQVLTTL